jgi:protein transport protein SEC61 subunit gamma-like protein
MVDLKRFFYQCKVALRLTRKPTKDEFANIVKITGIGILLIGAMGFVIQMIERYIFG